MYIHWRKFSCVTTEPNYCGVSQSFSGKATSLFIYFTYVLAYVQTIKV